MPPDNKSKNSALWGAAFLMATSAIGPGFLTQTTVFTSQLLASFGFVILISILLDIGVQLNIWRILVVANKRAQDVANIIFPGLGYFLTLLIITGGLAFNIGNIGGAGLGLQIITGVDPVVCSIISCCIALAIFWIREAGMALDWVVRIMGILMVLLTLYVAVSSHPPMAAALSQTIFPKEINTLAIVTIVGGTVGGYISFAGAHRLLDAGISGQASIPKATQSSVSGILITSFMRYILFLAALGVVAGGIILDQKNPAADVFKLAAGNIGYRFFGVVMWCASITSVIGAAYTSVSFLRTFHPALDKNHRWLTSAFIIFSTIVFAWIGQPVKVLVAVGTINGFILPIALAVILLAAYKSKIVGNYKHPIWMSVAGWLVVAIMLWLSFYSIVQVVERW